jgi:hypothetical protein
MSKKSRKQLHREISSRYSISYSQLENLKREAESRGELDEQALKRLDNEFQWSSKSRFPGLDKSGKDAPLLFIATRIMPYSGFRYGIYLVNNCKHLVESIEASSDGFSCEEDGIISVSGDHYSYPVVNPREAVLVQVYNSFHHSDFIIALDIKVESTALGNKVFRIVKKGGLRETVLLDATGHSKYLL